MKNQIKHYQIQLKYHEKKAEKLRETIRNIQDVCEHKHPDGTSALIEHTGIAYRYDECQICGKKNDMR